MICHVLVVRVYVSLLICMFWLVYAMKCRAKPGVNMLLSDPFLENYVVCLLIINYVV